MKSLLTLAALAPLAAGVADNQPIELNARVRPTSVTIVNPTSEPRLLLFGSHAGTPASTMWLAPGGDFEARFPAGTLDALHMQVLTSDERGWHASDSIHLGGLVESGSGNIDLIDMGTRQRFLSHSPRGPRFVEPGFELAPDTLPLGGGAPGTQASSAAAGTGTGHVPVVPPRDRKRSNRPPRVGPKPIPPV